MISAILAAVMLTVGITVGSVQTTSEDTTVCHYDGHAWVSGAHSTYGQPCKYGK